MRRRMGGLMPLLGVALALTALSGCSTATATAAVTTTPAQARSEGAPDDVMATVDGHPVVREEVEQVAELTGASTWEDRIRAAVRFKVIQLEAHRRGLVDVVDFSALIAEMRERNDENEAAAASGDVVYGVSSFDLATYFAHTESATRSALRAAMAEDGELDVTESRLRALYARDDGGLAEQPDTVVADLVRFAATDAGAAAAASVARALSSGADLASQLSRHADTVMQATTLDVDPDTAYTLSKYQTSLYSAVMGLQPGQVTVVADDVGGGIVLLRTTSRTPSPRRPFADVEAELRLRAQDDLFEQRVDDLVAAAHVEELAATPAP